MNSLLFNWYIGDNCFILVMKRKKTKVFQFFILISYDTSAHEYELRILDFIPITKLFIYEIKKH